MVSDSKGQKRVEILIFIKIVNIDQLFSVDVCVPVGWSLYGTAVKSLKFCQQILLDRKIVEKTGQTMFNNDCIMIKDIRPSLKNINVVFIVLEVGTMTLTKENREVRTFRVAEYGSFIHFSGA